MLLQSIVCLFGNSGPCSCKLTMGPSDGVLRVRAWCQGATETKSQDRGWFPSSLTTGKLACLSSSLYISIEVADLPDPLPQALVERGDKGINIVYNTLLWPPSILELNSFDLKI
ncbi:hypothetical protein BJ875DRAFT_278027 [Amylocarpus encephaloides]|uniref:Uncharacterized protein n=1 Tax=Amylocarpus encephaloides TaxID=45428 RepID=A0A9P8C625_9HELO|nr:hypothetical protein BJ875DRAFT_278027 [Amylocarpus encephaloides]